MTGCALVGIGPCDPGTEAHHVIPKQRIRARGWGLGFELADALADRRNLVALCRRHHHRITHGWDREPLGRVLAARITELREFARDYQLEPALDRELRLYGLLGGD